MSSVISPPTIIHTKFDSVMRWDHDLLSADLNQRKWKEMYGTQDVRMVVNVYLWSQNTIQVVAAREGQTVINKLRLWGMKCNRIRKTIISNILMAERKKRQWQIESQLILIVFRTGIESYCCTDKFTYAPDVNKLKWGIVGNGSDLLYNRIDGRFRFVGRRSNRCRREIKSLAECFADNAQNCLNV